VTGRLTAEPRLRLEFVGAPYDKLCQIANVDTTAGVKPGSLSSMAPASQPVQIPGFMDLNRTLAANN